MKSWWKYRWLFFGLFWVGLAQFLLIANVENFFYSWGFLGVCSGLMFFVPYTDSRGKFFGVVSIATILVGLMWITFGILKTTGIYVLA